MRDDLFAHGRVSLAVKVHGSICWETNIAAQTTGSYGDDQCDSGRRLEGNGLHTHDSVIGFAQMVAKTAS